MSRSEEAGSRSFLSRVAAEASDRVLDFVDPNQVLDHVDINALLDRVDVNELLDRVDVNELLDRVDVNELMDRVDVDHLMERVNVDDLMSRVDIRALTVRAGIPEIVAESTSQLGGSALDLFRKPVVALDEISLRLVNGLFGRNISDYPEGPGDLVQKVDRRLVEEVEGARTGRYAGPITRLLGFVIDSFVVTFGFSLIIAGASFLLGLVAPGFDVAEYSGPWFVVAFIVWTVLYLWISWAVFGKTIGKAILGARVVGADGTVVVQGRQALVRAITYPLSFAVFGLGLLGIVFGRERRAWHDQLARTAVVYDWGTRTAVMPTPIAEFLARRGAESEDE